MKFGKLGLVSLALLLGVFVGGGLVLQESTAQAAPKCAVTNSGKISCPVNLGKDTNNCYVLNPAKNNGEWKKYKCDSKEYKSAEKAPGDIPKCNKDDQKGCDPALNCQANCDIVKNYVNPLINALAAMVGVAVVASIVWAGIQYASSGDDPSKVSAAKARIIQSLIALLFFFLLYVFLQWLVPGGFIQG